MSTNAHKPIVCIVGPTASGKSALTQSVSQEIGAEIISADSMQVYRGMDIGTGKVPPEERVVPHHGLDLVDPGEPYSAALFQAYARNCISDIQGRGNQVVLCGGTGFYVRAVVDDYDFPKGEQVGNPVRDTFNAIAAREGAHALWLMLREADPASAEIIPENDVKRVVRAFELLEEGGSYAEQKEKLARIPHYYETVFIGLEVDPDILRNRIDARVDNMVEEGLVCEVKALLERGFREGITAPAAIGYKEVVSAIDGDISMDEAIAAIKTATHRYAKRQRTWFRKEKRIRWINADDFDVDSLTEKAVGIISRAECTLGA